MRLPKAFLRGYGTGEIHEIRNLNIRFGLTSVGSGFKTSPRNNSYRLTQRLRDCCIQLPDLCPCHSFRIQHNYEGEPCLLRLGQLHHPYAI